MTSWLWLLPPVIGVVIWIRVVIWILRGARRRIDLGSVSPQWLHEYRQTHHDR